MPKYHFDIGDTGSKPLGMCAWVKAESKQAAVIILKDAIWGAYGEGLIDLKIGDDEVEYCHVYLDPDNITVEDIDEVDGE